MNTYRKADEIYQSTLNLYRTYLSNHGDISLSSYCKDNHVFYSGMKRWMSTKKISIKNLRGCPNKGYSLRIVSSIPGMTPSVIPICMTHADKKGTIPRSAPLETISKVTITYPTGTIIEVENISYSFFQDLLSLTHNTTA